MINTKELIRALEINGINAVYVNQNQVEINDLMITLDNGLAKSSKINLRYRSVNDLLQILKQDRVIKLGHDQFLRILDDYQYFTKQLNNN